MDFFCDGLADELITDLSKIDSLRVIANNSVLKYKNNPASISEISENLNVNYLLEGSVRFSDKDLRVTAKLIDVETSLNIWADKYSGTLENIFEIQEKLSTNIVRSLKLKLDPKETKLLVERPIANLEAYQLYLKARKELHSFFSLDRYKNAIHLMNDCLKINGENALIYGTILTGYLGLLYAGAGDQSDKYRKKVKQYLNDIYRLDQNSEHWHFGNGALAFLSGNLPEALKCYKQALALNENHIEANVYLGIVLLEVGRPEAAEPLFRKLMELDPLTGLGYGLYGYKEWNHGRFQSALPYFRKGWELNPEDGISAWSYACACASCELIEDACQLVDGMSDKLKQSVFGKLSLFLKHALLKNEKEALSVVDEELIGAANIQAFISRDIAGYYAMIDHTDEALNYVEQAINLGYINYPFLAFHHPFYNPLRTNPRFIELMDDVKQRWEVFEI